MHGTMKVMDPSGHTEVNWDSGSEAEIAVARRTFEEMTRAGYQAFRTEGGAKAERLREFDPEAETMVLIPQLVSG